MLEQFLKIALMLLSDFGKLEKYVLSYTSHPFTHASVAQALFAQSAKRHAEVRDRPPSPRIAALPFGGCVFAADNPGCGIFPHSRGQWCSAPAPGAPQPTQGRGFGVERRGQGEIGGDSLA